MLTLLLVRSAVLTLIISNNIEALESRRMTLVLAKNNQSGNTDALSVIEREMAKIESRIFDYEAE